MNEADPRRSLHDLACRFIQLNIERRHLYPSRYPVSAFLLLPAELRIAIYECALLDLEPNLCLLCTCKTVNMEAQETLYLRPASLTSQAKLFAWIDRSKASNLSRVRTLTLRLTDIDLTPLLDRDSPRRQTRMSAWSLYKKDLEQLENVLHCLSKLEKLTIIPPRVGRSQLWEAMYQSLLAEIPNRCKRLRHLELHDREETLEEVPALKDLRSIDFIWPDLRSRSASDTEPKGPASPEAGASKANDWLEKTQTATPSPSR